MMKRDRFVLVAVFAAAIGCSAAETAGTGGAGGHGGAHTGGHGSVSSSSAASSSSLSSSSAASSSSASSSSSSSSGAGGAPMCGPMGSAALAVEKIYWGDTDPNDVPKAGAWMQYGFNLDGKVSTPASIDLCKPVNNASPNSVYPDGINGIDNSFGRNILPIFLGILPTFSDQTNAGITMGQYTLLLNIENLMAGPDQSPLVSKLYSASPLGTAPKFDGTDCWPVAPESLNNPADIESSKIIFPMSSVTMNHWDSGGDATILFSFGFLGFPFTLTIHHARVAMDLAPDHKSATGGQIGGILDTAEFVGVIKQLAGTLDPTLCMGATIDTIITQITQASDILADGSQDPAQTCNGISIGLGFKLKPVQVGLIGPVAPPPPNPCP